MSIIIKTGQIEDKNYTGTMQTCIYPTPPSGVRRVNI